MSHSIVPAPASLLTDAVAGYISGARPGAAPLATEPDDLAFMALALEEARLAEREGEVPVGAVLVRRGEVIARARNRRETHGDPTAHAEMLLIREAVGSGTMGGGWRFTEVTLYVTLEPCVMCMGASVLARIPRLVYGCSDPKGGAARTLYQLGNDPRLNHRVEVVGGVRGEEAGDLLRDFFRRLRARPRGGAGP